jgi:hypothetical protein
MVGLGPVRQVTVSSPSVSAGANRHDKVLLTATLDGIVVARPEPSEQARQHLTVDLGYDYKSSRNEAKSRAYEFHIPPATRCEAAPAPRAGQPAAALGGGADAQLAEPVAATARALGEEGGELPRHDPPVPALS